jgi:diguanylate cyclase (GGDEF)-like protein
MAKPHHADEDLVCRYGGEEFVILFPNRSANNAAKALNRVQQELLVSVAGGPPTSANWAVANSNPDTEKSR